MALASRWLGVIEGTTPSLSAVEDWESVSEPKANTFELVNNSVGNNNETEMRGQGSCWKKPQV